MMWWVHMALKWNNSLRSSFAEWAKTCYHNKQQCVKQCKNILTLHNSLSKGAKTVARLFWTHILYGIFEFRFSELLRLVQVNKASTAERPRGGTFKKTYLSIMTIIILWNGQINIYLPQQCRQLMDVFLTFSAQGRGVMRWGEPTAHQRAGRMRN